jgi:hypothetical protein
MPLFPVEYRYPEFVSISYGEGTTSIMPNNNAAESMALAGKVGAVLCFDTSPLARKPSFDKPGIRSRLYEFSG